MARAFRPRTLVAVLAVLALAAGVAACDDDDTTEVEVPPVERTVTALRTIDGDGREVTVVDIPTNEEGNEFVVSTVYADPGLITLRLINAAAVKRNIAIEEPVEMEGPSAGQGQVSSITADFPPGEYEYFTTLGRARQDGMTGTLIVR